MSACKHGYMFGYENLYDDAGNYLGNRLAPCPQCESEQAGWNDPHEFPGNLEAARASHHRCVWRRFMWGFFFGSLAQAVVAVLIWEFLQ